jgi:hypothetical protein
VQAEQGKLNSEYTDELLNFFSEKLTSQMSPLILGSGRCSAADDFDICMVTNVFFLAGKKYRW